MSNFIFSWYKNERYGNPIERTNKISANSASAATDLFCKTFGDLRSTTIVKIQEVDADGADVGLPILPAEETHFLPVGKIK